MESLAVQQTTPFAPHVNPQAPERGAELRDRGPERPDYLPLLTPIRGIAALWVVFFHLPAYFLLPSIREYLLCRWLEAGYLACDLFFVLSGFVLSHVYTASFDRKVEFKTYIKFMYARFSRIYPLHAFVLLMFVLLEVVKWTVLYVAGLGIASREQPFAGTHSPSSLAAQLFLLNGLGVSGQHSWNFPSWSISTEWWAYAVFPFLVLLIPRLSVRSRVALSILCLSGLYVLESLHGDLRLNIAGGPAMFRCLFEFTLGMLVYTVYKGRAGRLNRWTTPALILAPLAVAAAIFAGLPDTCVVLVACVTVLSAALQGPGRLTTLLGSRCMTFLGEISYSVYLMQIFVFELLRKVSAVLHQRMAFGSGSPSIVWETLFAAGVVAAVIGASTLTYRYVERPMQSALRGWQKSRLYWRMGSTVAGLMPVIRRTVPAEFPLFRHLLRRLIAKP